MRTAKTVLWRLRSQREHLAWLRERIHVVNGNCHSSWYDGVKQTRGVIRGLQLELVDIRAARAAAHLVVRFDRESLGSGV